jgi:hypothetical protein
VKFAGRSGAEHAPDVALSHTTNEHRVLLAAECKHRPSADVDRGLIMAFGGTLVDLGWPYLGALVMPPQDGALLRVAFRQLHSAYITTAKGTSPGEDSAARFFRFDIQLVRFPG